MKVVKRDGHIVDFDRSKIVVAIQKANAEVEPEDKVCDAKIEEIVKGIEQIKNSERTFRKLWFKCEVSHA